VTLHLCYSNCFDELVDALCEDLQSARRRGLAAVFTTAEIIVPNYSVAAYLKFAIAQRLGIAANLHFQFLQSFIANRVQENRAETEPELRVIDRPRLHALLCGVLTDDDLLAAEEMAPVRSYLYASGTDEDAVDIRRFQLAEQIAMLFSDYSLSRPEMLRTWQTGLALQDTRGAAIEVWQRALWLALFGPYGRVRRLADETGIEWVTAPELFDRVLAKDLGLPRHIHIIGFSYVPYAHHRIFARMARAADVHVYAINPCMEFWEDLQSGWEVRLAGRQLARRGDANVQLSFGDIDDTPPLRLWGRPGRENIRILNELTQCDFVARFVDPAEHGQGALTMLRALQRDILFRQPERTEPNTGPNTGIGADIDPDDDSIRVLGCPSVQRELEVIGNEIWRLIQRDPSLRFNDIAVLISRAEQELYQAHIPAVFGELHDIPHHLVDVPLSAESRIIEAFQLLLDLPFGRFTRPELLRVLTHPAVLARYPDVDPSDWVHWSERLGIVHGADHDDHLGTYIDKDVFNWQQGIRRLALGAFMAGERSGDSRAISFGETSYLPEELPSDLLPSAARFALVARSLISDARYCRSARMSLSEWRVFFDVLASSYLAPVDDDDERNLSRCRDAIETLATADIDGRAVSYRIACEMVRGELMGLSGAVGEFLAHGVTVAPLLPMRPIPYRVIFLAGMGEGRFPASERESPLDLRVARRRRGDVAPRERDRYLFLETLLAARDRLYLSYVSRNAQTGESLQPSSVILELSHILRRGYATGSAAEGITIQHPLRRYDPRYFPALFAAADEPGAEAPMVSVAPSAHRQANALALRRHLESKLREQGRDMPTFAELRRALSAPQFVALRQRLGLHDVADRDPGERGDQEESTVSISLSMVRRFLECPLQAWASAVLRLRESEMADLVARQDEAFATPVAPMVGMLRDVFAAHLAGEARTEDALIEQYELRAQHLELTGSAPVGVFSAIERERHTAILRRWHEHLMELTGGVGERFRTYSFGRAQEHSDVGALLPPIALSIELPDAAGQTRVVPVELHGRTEVVGEHSVGSLVLIHRDKPSARNLLPKYMLRGFVDQLALSAAGMAGEREHLATVLTACDQTARYRLEPWTRDEARAYLGVLVADLLGSSHEYLLPCEAVFEHLDRPERSLFGIVEQLKARGMGFSSLFGPVTQLDSLQAPFDADALIERRFGPLFSRLRDDDADR
jgi:exodeoxyribonuclease V gamma subunit